MKLFGSLTSPFVRAVRIAASELDLGDRIEFVGTVVKPTQPNRPYGERVHPLRRVPALEIGPDDVLFDSRVILEYLDAEGRGALFPPAERGGGRARIDCLNRQAVVAGAIEALVAAMYEMRLRPPERHWPSWSEDQIDKARAALAWCETHAAAFGTGFDASAIFLVCLIDYARFRFPDIDWLKERPRLAALHQAWSGRASVASTAPRE